MTLIADSGSTKTAWCLLEDPTHIIHTQGINPFQQNEEDICTILQQELLPQLSTLNYQLSTINFYGAGCTPEKAPLVAQAIRKTIAPQADIHVESDMLGAARGLCGHTPGIVCILGTGSNSCFYDGESLHAGMPALGYILGDEGSGAYIGKRLVGDVLKRQLPADICQCFFDETQETQATIIQKVYRQPLPNRFLASLSPFCARHREHPAIHAFLIDCFTQFFQRNIIPLRREMEDGKWKMEDGKCQMGNVNFVGSVAHYYRDELAEAASSQGYSIGRILQAPLEGLVEFHKV